jgi:hypothetical protein
MFVSIAMSYFLRLIQYQSNAIAQHTKNPVNLLIKNKIITQQLFIEKLLTNRWLYFNFKLCKRNIQ